MKWQCSGYTFWLLWLFIDYWKSQVVYVISTFLKIHAPQKVILCFVEFRLRTFIDLISTVTQVNKCLPQLQWLGRGTLSKGKISCLFDGFHFILNRFDLLIKGRMLKMIRKVYFLVLLSFVFTLRQGIRIRT